MLEPYHLFGILSDPTRLRALMLVQAEGELCVCELTFALDESQPKMSRHLRLMRDAGIVEARREGTWMHYRISRKLPDWSKQVIKQVLEQIEDLKTFKKDMSQLKKMTSRPRGRAGD